jgi:hypothetical protein
MPSPFDKVTESQDLRNYMENRPVVEELARSQGSVFQSEMSRLGLEEKQKEIAMRDENLQAVNNFNQSVVSQATNSEDLMKKTQEFIKKNPKNAGAIMEYAGEASLFFEAGNRNKLSGIELERATRENEMQKKFQKLQEKSVQATYDANLLKFAQDKANMEMANYKANKNKIDGITDIFASVDSLEVDETTKTGIENVNNFYYKKINDLSGREDSQSKIESEKYYDEASSIFGPLLEFDSVNKVLRSTAAIRHAETKVKAEKQYSQDYAKWLTQKKNQGTDAASLTFDDFLIDSYNTRFDSGSAGNAMLMDNDQAEMIEDFGELAEARNQFQKYNKALLDSIDPITGAPREDKIGSIRRQSRSLSISLKQSIDRHKIKAETKTQQSKQQEAELSLLETKADIENTKSLTKARNEGRIDDVNPALQSLESERADLIKAIRQEKSRQAGAIGEEATRRGKIIEDLGKELSNVEGRITNFASSNPAKTSSTNQVEPAN